MIEINLLKNRKIKKTKEKKAPLVSKKMIYFFFGFIVVFFVIWYAVPYFMIRETSVKPIQPSAAKVEETTPAIDTTKVAEEEKPEIIVTKEPEPTPPPPEETAKSTFDFSVTNERVSTFLNILNIIKSNEKIGVLAITEDKFIIEVLTNSREEAGTHSSNLKDKLQNAGIQSNVSSIDDSKISIKSWGSITAEAKQQPPEKQQNLNFIYGNLNQIARNNNILITETISTKPYIKENFKFTPVTVRMKGSRKNCIRFIKELRTKNFNIIIEKINFSETVSKLVNLFSIEFLLVEPAG